MKLIYVAVCLILAILAPVCSSLFINNAINVRKVQSFRKLYDKSTELNDQPSASFENKLSALIKNSPLLSVQNTLSVLILGSAVTEFLKVIPKEAQRNVQAQSVLVALLVKLITAVQTLDVADFPTRDEYFTKDLLVRAKDEVGKLVVSPVGMSTVYLAVVLATQCRTGATVPFLIGEAPSLLRYLAIICIISWPKKSSVMFPNVEWLFGTKADPGDDAAGATSVSAIDIDAVCDYAASLTEIVVVSKIAFGLFRTSKGAPIRGFSDMLVLSGRILLIQNFLYLRASQVLRSSYSSAWVHVIKKQPLVQQALSLAEPSAWPAAVRGYGDLARQLAHPATRIAALRKLLGRHNIAVPDAGDLPATKAPSEDARASESPATAVDPPSDTSSAHPSSPLPKRGAKKKDASKGKAASQRRNNYKTIV